MAGDFELSAHYQGASYTVVTYGNYAYYNTGGDIHIMDISDPYQIHEIKCYIESDLPVLDMVIQGHYLFMTSYNKGIKIFDLSDPLNPEYISNAYNKAYPKAILVANNLLISITNSWPQIFDISDIKNPVYLSWIDYSSGNNEKSYALKDMMLYMSGWYGPGYDLYVIGFDLSDPSDPQLSVSLNLNVASTTIWPDAMEIMDDLLCVAYNDTVKLFDISSRDTIVYLPHFALESTAYSMTSRQHTLIIGMENGKIELFDLTDVFHQVSLGSYQAPGPPKQILAGDTIMFLSMEVKGFQILDISNPIEPELIYENSETEAFNIIRIQDSIVFFSHGPNGLQAYNLSDLMNPVPLGRIDSLGWLAAIESVPGFLYCKLYNDSSLYVVDVRDPEHLQVIDTIWEPTWGKNFFTWGKPFFIYEDRLYIHTGDKQIKIYDLTLPEHPVKIDSFYVEGYVLAGNDSLFILSIDEYQNGMNSYLSLYQYTGDTTAQLMDKLKLGLEDTHRVFQLEFKLPYILARVQTGIVVIKISPTLKLEIIDQKLGYFVPDYVCYDNRYIYLASGKDGTPQINIYNWEDPFQITLHKTIDRYSSYLAVSDSILFSSEGYGGFSIYGYYPMGFPIISVPFEREALKVFPNPGNEMVTIDCSKYREVSQENFTLRVCDMQGRRVLEKKIRPEIDQIQLTTSIWKPGIYFFSLSEGNRLIANSKVIIK